MAQKTFLLAKLKSFRLFSSVPALLLAAAIALPSAGFAKTIQVPADIQRTLEVLQKRPDARDQARVRAIQTLIQKLQTLQIPPVQKLLQKTDLSQEVASMMLRNSKGFYSVSDLQNLPDFKSGFSLGLSAQAGIYEMLSERFHLNAWSTAYNKFGIDWHKVPNHTEIFLNRVEQTGRPVVFFLPNQLLSYKKKSITANEFKWFMQDPKRMKNVYFVLGAYDIMTDEIEALRVEAGMSNDQMRSLVMRALGAENSSWDGE